MQVFIFFGVSLTMVILTAVVILAISGGRSSTDSFTENGTVSAGKSVDSNGTKNSSRVLQGPALYKYEIVKTYPHDPTAFTQGLLHFSKDILYESTGMYRESSVREVNLTSGKVLKETKCANSVFGEGLVLWKDSLLQVTWRTNEGIRYERATLKRLGTFKHGMSDGWGLTSNGSLLLGTDGSSALFFLDPTTFKAVSRKEVKDGPFSVKDLNELEFVENKVLANVWQTECIAQISPQTGRVTAWILLQGLRDIAQKRANGRQIDVLNGIAWEKSAKRLFVTGKYWPVLFEIRLKKVQNVTSREIDEARSVCILQ